MKDWTGTGKSIFVCNGASNHSECERQSEDYYATNPVAIDLLFYVEKFDGYICECSCGEGHLSKRMVELGAEVYSTDLVYRGFGVGGVDFL